MENNVYTNEIQNQSLFFHAVYEGTIEIMGKPKTDLIFSAISEGKSSGQDSEKENRPQIIANLGNEFAIRFHRNTAKGLLLRIGESSFTYLRKGIKRIIDLGDIENRLKPISKRFEGSLQVLAETLSELTALKIQVIKKNESSFCLEIGSDETKELLSSDLYLYYFMGLLRAFSRWLESRKEYSFQIDGDKTDDLIGKRICMKLEDIT